MLHNGRQSTWADGGRKFSVSLWKRLPTEEEVKKINICTESGSADRQISPRNQALMNGDQRTDLHAFNQSILEHLIHASMWYPCRSSMVPMMQMKFDGEAGEKKLKEILNGYGLTTWSNAENGFRELTNSKHGKICR